MGKTLERFAPYINSGYMRHSDFTHCLYSAEDFIHIQHEVVIPRTNLRVNESVQRKDGDLLAGRIIIDIKSNGIMTTVDIGLIIGKSFRAVYQPWKAGELTARAAMDKLGMKAIHSKDASRSMSKVNSKSRGQFWLIQKGTVLCHGRRVVLVYPCLYRTQ